MFTIDRNKKFMANQKNSQIIKIKASSWELDKFQSQWAKDLENGKVLYIENLKFSISPHEKKFFNPTVLNKNSRNISLDSKGKLKGAEGSEKEIKELTAMIGRFRKKASTLIFSAFPKYKDNLKLAPTSFRPMEVSSRVTSWRADDKRLHIDAFPSRPNYGERILRVFINVSLNKKPRVWRIGEPFEDIAKRYIHTIKPYSYFQAKIINFLGISKSLRSKYDHLMLGLHDAMKSDMQYQKNSPQITMPFKPGTVWICFSDQAAHAAMSGQFMMEQTFHLPPSKQYFKENSPLEVLRRLTGEKLI
jgi:3-deoxy-D-manno-oct-2-ulosonic acid (Kdo) hydroxylase